MTTYHPHNRVNGVASAPTEAEAGQRRTRRVGSMLKHPSPTVELVRTFVYDAATGFIYRNVRPDESNRWHSRFAGRPAGSKLPSGKTLIAHRGHSVYSEYLAWLLRVGSWPRGKVRFLDGDITNAAWANLYSTDRDDMRERDASTLEKTKASGTVAPASPEPSSPSPDVAPRPDLLAAVDRHPLNDTVADPVPGHRDVIVLPSGRTDQVIRAVEEQLLAAGLDVRVATTAVLTLSTPDPAALRAAQVVARLVVRGAST